MKTAEEKKRLKTPYAFSKEDTLSVKAIAVMLMLIHHLFTFPEKFAEGVGYTSMHVMSDGQNVEQLLGNFSKLCVALFMLLSGYGIYKSYMLKEQPVGNKTLSSIVIKRIKNVYIKYWQIIVVFGIIGLLIGSEKISHAPVDWVKNLIGIDTTFNDESWFLTMYVIVVCLFPFVVRWFARKHSNPWTDMVWLLIFNTLVITALSRYIGSTEFMSDFNGTYFWSKFQVALVMLPMFMGGCIMAKYDMIENLRNCFAKGYIAKIAGVIILVVVFILRQNWGMRVAWGWDRLDFIYAGLFTMSMALILDGLKHVKMVLAFIGKYSTGIWLSHSFYCYYYCQSVIYAPKNPILIFLFLLAIALGTARIIDFVGHFLYKSIMKVIK